MELQTRGRRNLLTADRLQVHVGSKQLLHSVSAVATSGSLLAVMGPSGSGKTTFLNTLSGRMSLSSGSISLNGQPLSTRIRKSFGYVTQSDIFFPVLTLRQTLEFAARVKLPATVGTKQLQQRIQEVVQWLQLEKCMETAVGSFMSPGLSGGEKKRANVACELLPNPDVLLLDEPTSGLDSSLAMTLIDLLRNWSAKEGKIVVMSIHQPSSQIFHVFDDLLLLTDGHTSYCGRQDAMVEYFGSIGVPFQMHWNPADYMLEVVKQSSDSKQLIIDKGSQFSDLQRLKASRSTSSGSLQISEESKDAEELKEDEESKEVEKVDELQENGGGRANASFEAGDEGDAAVEMPAGDSLEVEFVESAPPARVSWRRQLLALTIRSFYVSRSRYLSPEPIVRSVFLCLMCSLLWFQIARTEDHIRDISGCIFFLTTNLSFMPLFEAIMTFLEDMHVVRHERRAGMYQIGAYYVAKIATEMPLVIAVPFLVLTVVFWTAGLGGFLQYLAFVVAILLNSLACQGVGVFIGLLTPIPKANLTIALIFMLTSLLLGGFFSTAVPVWLIWAKYLSFIRYCFHFCLLTVLENSADFACSQSGSSAYPSCANATRLNETVPLPAAEILRLHPETMQPMWANFGIILLFLVAFRIIGYLWLRFMKKE